MIVWNGKKFVAENSFKNILKTLGFNLRFLINLQFYTLNSGENRVW